MTGIPDDTRSLDMNEVFHGVSVDGQLQSLVDLANDFGLEMGITLLVGGTLISGTLVSGRTFFEATAADMAEAWPFDNKKQIHAAFAAPAERYANAAKDGIKTPDPTNPRPQFIHLRGARTFAPDGFIPGTGMLMRIKLNAVSGFSMGELR